MKEHDQALTRISELEHEKDSFERELSLLRSVEEQVKRQLQTELSESRHREEDSRQQLVEAEAEYKRREAFMKEQWLKDLQDKEHSEEAWEQKLSHADARIIVLEHELSQALEARSQLASEISALRDSHAREIESLRREQPPKLIIKQIKSPKEPELELMKLEPTGTINLVVEAAPPSGDSDSPKGSIHFDPFETFSKDVQQ